MNSFPTNEEKEAVGEIDATNEVERAGCAAALGLKTTLGLTQGEIVAAIRGVGEIGRVDVENVERGAGEDCLETPRPRAGGGTVLGRSQWGIRGAWDDDYYQAFAADWVFPFRSNRLSGVKVQGVTDEELRGEKYNGTTWYAGRLMLIGDAISKEEAHPPEVIDTDPSAWFNANVEAYAKWPKDATKTIRGGWSTTADALADVADVPVVGDLVFTGIDCGGSALMHGLTAHTVAPQGFMIRVCKL